MKLLRQGSQGADVELWQNFLRGRGFAIVADGSFGPKTVTETRTFQRRYKLGDDGAVGARTWGKALSLGLGGALDLDADGADWPPKPQTLIPYVTNAERERIFGHFDYEPAPTPQNPERIRVLGDWAQKHIRPLEVKLPGAATRKLWLHEAALDAFRDTIEHWRREKLLNKILTWNGSYVARFIRGSKTTLSNHAFGSAVDLNAAYNRIGHVPPLKGQKGSVRELVQIANEHGIFWGGHYARRLDGMHMEVGKRL